MFCCCVASSLLLRTPASFKSIDEIESRMVAIKKQLNKFQKMKVANKVKWATSILDQLEAERATALAQGDWLDRSLQELEDRVSGLELAIRTHSDKLVAMVTSDSPTRIRSMVRDLHHALYHLTSDLASLTTVAANATATTHNTDDNWSESYRASVELLQKRIEFAHLLMEQDYTKAAVVDLEIWEIRLKRIEAAFPDTNALLANRTWQPSLDEHRLQLDQLHAILVDRGVMNEVVDAVATRRLFLAAAYCQGAPRIPFWVDEPSCHNMFSGASCVFQCQANLLSLGPLRCERGHFAVTTTGCYNQDMDLGD